MTVVLDPGQRRELRRRLETLRSELQDSIEGNREAGETVELDQTRQGRLSRMDAMQHQAMAKAAGQRAVTKLRNVEQALQRIDDEDFGLCEECGELIPYPRLMVDPTVTLCIRCAEAIEQS